MPLEQARAFAKLTELWRDNRGAAHEVFEQWTAVREVEKAKYLARDREIKEAHRPRPVQLSLTSAVPFVLADGHIVHNVPVWPDDRSADFRRQTVHTLGSHGWWFNRRQTDMAYSAHRRERDPEYRHHFGHWTHTLTHYP